MTRTVLPVALLALVVSLTPATRASAQTPKFEQPVLVTSAGQSAEVTIAGMLFKKAEIPVKVAPQAKVADLEGQKTLVVAPGFSSKGLGSAGIDKDQEMGRVKALIAAAQKAKMPILVLHLGGKPRRGAQSDEFNKVVGAAATYLIVVKAGDEDQFFTKLAGERKIPIELVDRMSDATGPIGKLFK